MSAVVEEEEGNEVMAIGSESHAGAARWECVSAGVCVSGRRKDVCVVLVSQCMSGWASGWVEK